VLLKIYSFEKSVNNTSILGQAINFGVVMNAITLLKDDHRLIKHFLRQIKTTTETAAKTRKRLFQKLHLVLKTHTGMEETYFYPALRNAKTTHTLVLEAFEEHNVVDELAAQLSKDNCATEKWTAKFTLLKELLEHHIKEEEDDLFIKAKKVLDDEELKAIGFQMFEFQNKKFKKAA
jgi:hemerythrin-like domain-containing protein